MATWTRELVRAGRLACAAALVLFVAAPAAAQTVPPGAPLSIVARGPNPEIRVRGVSLKSARADDAQNEVAFDFNGPVDQDIFGQLQNELPDWIEIAYSGYDTAIIRTRKPVTFLTRREADGFSLRMVPRGTPPPDDPTMVALRGANDTPDVPPAAAHPPPAAPLLVRANDWKVAKDFFARAAVERPFDVAIRRGYDSERIGDASFISISGDWRHTKGSMIATNSVHADFEAWSGVRVLENFNDVIVNAKAVRRLDGSIASFNRNDMSGSVGLGFQFDSAVATAEFLYGRTGPGGRLGARLGLENWQLGMTAAYREPYIDTAEAVADRATRDYSSLYAAGQILGGLWASGEVDATRYEVHADSDVARTAGFKANLRYDLDGWPLSLSYSADGEYVVHRHTYPGVAPTPFVPLSIRDREVHALSGAFSEAWSNSLWFDLYGGYAVDRYSKNGAFGGAALRYTPADGFDLSMNGRYSRLPDRQGEQGEEITAGLTLTYAWAGGDSQAPILRAGPGAL